MGFLLFTARRRLLHSQIYTYQSQLDTITRKIADLQQYAANIADGSLTLDELANSPYSVFGRAVNYMNYSTGMASNMTENNWQWMKKYYENMPSVQQMQPQERAQFEQYMYQSLYQQALTEVAKQESKYLHQQEKVLEQEKQQLETKLNMAKEEMKSCIEAEKEGIKDFAPKYTSGQ